MLFNSHVFIFLFLPITLFVFFCIGRLASNRRAIGGQPRTGRATCVPGTAVPRLALGWLIVASLFFYGWWNPAYLALILASIGWNYAIGLLLVEGKLPSRWRVFVLAAGVASNLAALGFFKYADFLIENVNRVSGSGLPLPGIALPLAISFFTFQQIAYLVDTFRCDTAEHSFLHYCLFVSFFPQLIAGPIVHHREMLPQFSRPDVYRPSLRNLEIGLTIFFIGLFKKVVIADGVAGFATPVFAAAEAGHTLSCLEAWRGALAYTFQLYFDFSGYSDMAIGLGRLFGIKLPLNFHSPYKASSIIDFWKCWHMTLSRFLRDYLYIPLGGNRKGPLRRYANLLVTMLLGGLWHGAGWSFVVWGGLHGVYLAINHGWRALNRSFGFDGSRTTGLGRALARTTTFLAVIVGWVFFRAGDLSAASSILRSMAGLEGIALPRQFEPLVHMLRGGTAAVEWLGLSFTKLPHFSGSEDLWTLAILMLVVWWAPNTQQIMARVTPALDAVQDATNRECPQWLRWQPSPRWAVLATVLTVVSILHMSRVSEFLYFQF